MALARQTAEQRGERKGVAGIENAGRENKRGVKCQASN